MNISTLLMSCMLPVLYCADTVAQNFSGVERGRSIGLAAPSASFSPDFRTGFPGMHQVQAPEAAQLPLQTEKSRSSAPGRLYVSYSAGAYRCHLSGIRIDNMDGMMRAPDNSTVYEGMIHQLGIKYNWLRAGLSYSNKIKANDRQVVLSNSMAGPIDDYHLLQGRSITGRDWSVSAGVYIFDLLKSREEENLSQFDCYVTGEFQSYKYGAFLKRVWLPDQTDHVLYVRGTNFNVGIGAEWRFKFDLPFQGRIKDDHDLMLALYAEGKTMVYGAGQQSDELTFRSGAHYSETNKNTSFSVRDFSSVQIGLRVQGIVSRFMGSKKYRG